MRTDLRDIAGFNIELDTNQFKLFTDGLVQYKRKIRYAKDLLTVLRKPDEVSPEEKMYYMFYVEGASKSLQELFERTNLTYSPVLLPPKKVGKEFIKTTGHYHPEIPGSDIAYPEIYLQLHGKLLLLMQRRNTKNPDKIEDAVVYEMKPGDAVNMPPGYGHCVINHTGNVSLMAGLYSPKFKPFYDPIKAHRGMAYYVIEEDGKVVFERNPNYPDTPLLRKLTEIKGSKFEPPYVGKPVFEMFLKCPEDYEYLSDLEKNIQFHGLTTQQ